VVYAFVERDQREKLLLIERGKSGALDAAEVAARAFDPEDFDELAREGVDVLDLGTGVSAGKVRDAEIGAEKVGAIAEEFRFVESGCKGGIPAVFKELEGSGG
jgi:hypothetical protein